MIAGAFAAMPTTACLTVDGEMEWLNTQIVPANFFDVLEVRPLVGRTFKVDEDQTPGGNPLLVISERLWRRRFHASSDVVGQVVDLNRHAFTIIGVVPADFAGSMPPAQNELCAPASMITEVRNQSRELLTARDARSWHDLVRLRPGATVAQANSAPVVAKDRLHTAYPKLFENVTLRIVPLSEFPGAVRRWSALDYAYFWS